MQGNSLTNNDLTNLQQPTKDFVRNFNPFMQNKPKLRNRKMTISYCTQRTYKDPHPLEPLKNKPKQSQNKPKVKIGKIDTNPLFKKDLYKFSPLRTYKNEPKTNPIRKDNYR